jgi:sulfonate transport system substrate-binding protein
MTISRRPILALLPALAAGLSAPLPTRADETRLLRVGYQKGEPMLVAAEQNGGLAGPDVRMNWIEFEYGPPILEAMRAGAIDIGGVGDTPPVFAQATHADLVYITAELSGGSAVLVPPGSKLQTLQDLKGKKIAFARGSSAHNLTIAALAKANLTYTDITPVYLAPSDAAAAFMRGDVDAWTVWDPYYAMFETRPGVRVLATAHDITPQNSFYLANRRFAERNPFVLAKAVAQLRVSAGWAGQHHDKVAALIAAATSVPLAAMRTTMQRNPCTILPMSETIIAEQQQVADRFFKLGLIPQPIRIRDAVWRPSA